MVRCQGTGAFRHSFRFVSWDSWSSCVSLVIRSVAAVSERDAGCCCTRVASYTVSCFVSDQHVRASLRATAHNAPVLVSPFARSRAYCTLNGFSGSRLRKFACAHRYHNRRNSASP